MLAWEDPLARECTDQVVKELAFKLTGSGMGSWIFSEKWSKVLIALRFLEDSVSVYVGRPHYYNLFGESPGCISIIWLAKVRGWSSPSSTCDADASRWHVNLVTRLLRVVASPCHFPAVISTWSRSLHFFFLYLPSFLLYHYTLSLGCTPGTGIRRNGKRLIC